jgi:hypothetical protein
MEGSADEASAQPSGWTARAADRSWGLIRRIHLATRRPANWVQLFKFGLVGASGYVVNLIVFALLTEALDVHHIAAAIGAVAVAVTTSSGTASGRSGPAMATRAFRRPGSLRSAWSASASTSSSSSCSFRSSGWPTCRPRRSRWRSRCQ